MVYYSPIPYFGCPALPVAAQGRTDVVGFDLGFGLWFETVVGLSCALRLACSNLPSFLNIHQSTEAGEYVPMHKRLRSTKRERLDLQKKEKIG